MATPPPVVSRMYCFVWSPPMTVRAVRPAAAARSRKSATARPRPSQGRAAERCRRHCHASEDAGQQPKMKSYVTGSVCVQSGGIRVGRIGLQNVSVKLGSLGRISRIVSAVARRKGAACASSRSGQGRFVGVRLDGAPGRTRSARQVDTGTISGTVKDESGGVLPGATVTITHEGQAFTLTTVTREDGTYIFTPIRTGAYVDRQSNSRGSGKACGADITVGIQEQVRVDFTLQAGAVAEEVAGHRASRRCCRRARERSARR